MLENKKEADTLADVPASKTPEYTVTLPVKENDSLKEIEERYLEMVKKQFPIF
ncbi:hypothetical protein [uncultured Ligilactobacillus sp.]|uniref:hypothetical protein n=1 Tax=uncultured Ligilactobacillus sp. TaxID=2837633 RepID=UPI00272A6977|nr:hypothetical protein [uncultured Ligilactobacillus sp.]